MTGERLSGLSVERLQGARPRLLSKKSELIEKAADRLIQSISKIGGGLNFRELILEKVSADTVSDDGLMVMGSLVWSCKITSAMHRRARRVQIPMDVVAGDPLPVTHIADNAGRVYLFDGPTILEFLHVTPGLSFGKKLPKAGLSIAG